MEPTLKVAKKFPNVKFEHATGYKRAANVSTYNDPLLRGPLRHAARSPARCRRPARVGYIASFPIPEVVMGINAFMLGAQSVNPNVKVKIVWVNSWFDPGKEADAAKALLDQGADILAQHTDSAAPLQEAEKAGKLAFGQSSDMVKFAPKAQLTSHHRQLGRLLHPARPRRCSTAPGRRHDTWGGIKDGMVVLAPFTNMPDDVKAMAEDDRGRHQVGQAPPLHRPVTKQDGTWR